MRPTPPQITQFVPSSREFGKQDSDQFMRESTFKEATRTKQPLLDNDITICKEKRFTLNSENTQPRGLGIRRQEKKRGFSMKNESIPLTPRTNGKSLRNERTEYPLTPLSLDHSSRRKADGFPDDLWEATIQPSLNRSLEGPEMVSAQDIKKIDASFVQLAPLEYPHNVINPSDCSLQLPATSTNECCNDIRADYDEGDVEKPNPQIKQTGPGSQFWPLKTSKNLCGDISASPIRLERHDATPNVTVACKYSSPSDSTPSNVIVRKGEGFNTEDSHGVSRDDDIKSDVCQQMNRVHGLVQRPELRKCAEGDQAWVTKDFKNVSHRTGQDWKYKTEAAAREQPVRKIHLTPSGKIESDCVFAESFSTACAIENYICLKKGVNLRSQQTASHHFPIMKPAVHDDLDEKKSEDFGVNTNTESCSVLPSMEKSHYAIPNAGYFVISTDLLRNRKLAYGIQRLCPGANLIERDFPLPQSHRNRHQARPDNTSNLLDSTLDEADITVSPGTGIILTTLQRIGQCSLPGQPIRFIVRERIARVAPRYERLLVLIGADNVRSCAMNEKGNAETCLADSHYKAVAEFMGFCATLKQDTQAIFIAGTEQHLIEWIVAMMVKYGVSDPRIKLIPEETIGEIFLRRAGFNSYAAQVILGELGGQGVAAESHQTASREGGLTAFMEMSVEQRVKTFEKIFGGSNLLGMVGAHLDARW